MSLKFSHQLPTPALFDSIHQLAEVLGEKSGAMPPFVESEVKAVSKGDGTAGRSNSSAAYLIKQNEASMFDEANASCHASK